MKLDDPIIHELRDADPARDLADRRELDSAVDRVLLARVLDARAAGASASRAPRGGRRPGRPRHLLSGVVALVAVAVVVILLAGHQGARRSASPSGSGGSVTLVYAAQPSAASPRVTASALRATVASIRARLDTLGVAPTPIVTESGDRIAITLVGVHDIARAETVIAGSAPLSVSDWEANVLLPDGHTVASELAQHNPLAERISQGGEGGPGASGAGGVSLYQAVRLAARQLTVPDSQLCSAGSGSRTGCVAVSRRGAQYYLFAAPNSRACAVAAGDRHTVALAGEHCLLAGPAASTTSLRDDLVGGVSFWQGTVLAVPQGTVVLQAADPRSAAPLPASDPAARYFVLRDRVALSNGDITDPQPGRDSTGAPDVTFGFTTAGARAFQSLTAVIARRGVTLGDPQPIDQHYVMAIGDRIVTVPVIDSQEYPDGVLARAGAGAQITGGLTTQQVSQIAAELRDGGPLLTLTLLRG